MLQHDGMMIWAGRELNYDMKHMCSFWHTSFCFSFAFPLLIDKEKLLQDLRNFTNKLYEKDNRIKNNSLGWEVIAKKLNKEEDNMKKSINDNIVSSDDIINSIIIIDTLIP